MGAWQKPICAAVAALALAGCGQPSPATEPQPERASVGTSTSFEGVATVSDGDTLRIGMRRILLHGIDTPAQGSRCGDVNVYRSASDALRAAVRNQRVRCTIRDLPDAEGRDVAQCSAGDLDLNAHMVSTGWARDWPRTSGGAYADEEAAARSAQLGVWAADCPANLWGDRRRD